MAQNPSIALLGGNGKFGAWFVRFFEKAGLSVVVLGRANREVWLTEVTKADIVIVSVPIAHTAETIRAIRDAVRPDALLCDFTSLKQMPLEEMLKTTSGCGVTGIHPMFGPLVTSLKGQHIVFCAGRDNAWTAYLKNLFQEHGAQILDASANAHDEKMAVVQALTHFVNVLFGAVVRQQDMTEMNAYSSPVFRLQSILSARVLGGKAEMYADIAMLNPAFREVLSLFETEAEILMQAVRSNDRDAYVQAYNAAAASLAQSIPLAQARSTELFHLVDRQPMHVQSAVQNRTPIALEDRAVFALGPEGTFSHLAVQQLFGETHLPTFCERIHDVFEQVLNGPAGALGVVPIENSTQGIVQETLDAFIRFPVTVVRSHMLPVHLCLFGSAASLEDIEVIRSHPQPLAQAKGWIQQHLPNARLETAASTAKPVGETQDPHVAFIGRAEVAHMRGLTILAENIEDKKNNATEFYVIAKEPDATLSEQFQAQKTAMLLIVHDRPGVLRDILDAFARRNINLTKLHSKSSDLEDYDYYFFLEAEGTPHTPAMAEALEEIASYCYITRVLGSA